MGNVVYVDVLSEKADCKATLTKVLTKLHKTYIVDLNQKWMFVEGDAKVYDLLLTYYCFAKQGKNGLFIQLLTVSIYLS